MTQEDKKLLLVDLCARLPYAVICYGITKETDEDGNYIDKGVTNILYELHSYKCCYGLVGLMNKCDIESIKPYLRPMSSMTEEEKQKYQYITERWMYDADYSIADSIDWLNAHHFDFHNLIEKGLALEAPEGMYNNKEEQK